MTRMAKNGECCLCGGPYEGFGHNPKPLWERVGDRCCTACNEVVIEARLDPAKLMYEVERAEAALLRLWPHSYRMALAAVCAARGPVLLEESERALRLIRAKMDDDARCAKYETREEHERKTGPWRRQDGLETGQ